MRCDATGYNENVHSKVGRVGQVGVGGITTQKHTGRKEEEKEAQPGRHGPALIKRFRTDQSGDHTPAPACLALPFPRNAPGTCAHAPGPDHAQTQTQARHTTLFEHPHAWQAFVSLRLSARPCYDEACLPRPRRHMLRHMPHTQVYTRDEAQRQRRTAKQPRWGRRASLERDGAKGRVVTKGVRVGARHSKQGCLGAKLAAEPVEKASPLISPT